MTDTWRVGDPIEDDEQSTPITRDSIVALMKRMADDFNRQIYADDHVPPQTQGHTLSDLASGAAYPGGVRPSPRQNAFDDSVYDPCDGCDGLSLVHTQRCYAQKVRERDERRRAEWRSRLLREEHLEAMGFVIPTPGESLLTMGLDL